MLTLERSRTMATCVIPRGSRPFAHQELPQEEDLGRLEVVLVHLPREAVALVLAHDVPDGDAVLPHRGEDLLRLREGDAGIVLALDNQDRRADLARGGQRRDPL